MARLPLQVMLAPRTAHVGAKLRQRSWCRMCWRQVPAAVTAVHLTTLSAQGTCAAMLHSYTMSPLCFSVFGLPSYSYLENRFVVAATLMSTPSQ